MAESMAQFTPTSPHLAVVDEFLPTEAFEQLKKSIQSIEIYPPGPEEFPGLVWRLGDTPPQISRYVHDSQRQDPASPFSELAKRLAETHIEIEGKRHQLKQFSARLQVARIGMGLSCHYDGNDRLSGGYAFYLSEEWDPHWGGLLIAFDESPTGFTPSVGRFSLLDTDKERTIFSRTIINSMILPKANRLVLLRNPVRHMVTPVLASAGDRVRIACTGYFVCEPLS